MSDESSIQFTDSDGDQAGAAGRFSALPRSDGGFRLLKELGRGAMGVVYEAVHEASGRHVALKVLTQRLRGSPEAFDQFRREALAAAAIAHPNCVFVHGIHAVDEGAAISMELVPGGSLDRRVAARAAIPTKTAVRWAIDIIDGLEAAQAAGVIHRDVKPANCFLDARMRVQVGDFGLTHLVSEGATGSPGAFVGSPRYASPEQVQGTAVDFRTDMYSAGATLYTLLTRQAPFTAATTAELFRDIVHKRAAFPTAAAKRIPSGLQNVVLCALETDREKRFHSYADFRRALQPYASTFDAASDNLTRYFAYAIDRMILIVPATAVVLLAVYSGVLAGQARVWQLFWTDVLGGLVVPLAYFGLLEGLTGATIGKRLLGMRVVSTATGLPSVPRACARYVLIGGIPAAVSLIVGLGLNTNTAVWGVRPSAELATTVGTILFLAAMFSTAQAKNAFRGVHELLSGTQLIGVRSAAKERDEGRETFEPSAPPAACPPKSVGHYGITGHLGSTTTGELWVARDEALHRTVWVHEMQHGSESAPVSHTTFATQGALRWLDGVRDERAAYDVYEEPGGGSLTWCVRSGWAPGWPRAREVIRVLAQEVAGRDGAVATGQVWLGRGAAVRVLDFQMREENDGAQPSSIATLMAAGRAMLLANAPDACVLPRDLPISAEPVVRRLLGLAGNFADCKEALKNLRTVDHGPCAVARGRRCLQVLLANAVALIVLLATIVASAGLPIARLALVVAGAGVIGAVLLRGGASLSVAGLGLRTGRGLRASRLRCAIRALFSWESLIGCCLMWSSASHAADPLVVGGVVRVALIVAAASAVWAVALPRRGLADLIAGTRIVRR